MAMQRLLTTKEVAHQLGVSAKLLEAHRAELRGLPYIQIGRLIRYRATDVEHAESFGVVNRKEVQHRRQVVASIHRHRSSRKRRLNRK